jgi:hypothetical protein
MTVLSSELEDRTRHFTGRQWVFDAIGRWLSDPAGARVFLLTGGPGTGKTAIAARIAQMNEGRAEAASPLLRPDCLAYAHFCQAGIERTISPVSFVQALSEALANRYPAFRAALIKAGSTQIVVNTQQQIGSVAPGARVIGAQIGQIVIEIKGGDARPLFDDAVGRPLRDLVTAAPALDRIVILVDSLDEALSFGADHTIAHLLGVASDFPPQVRFLLTARSGNDRVFDLVGPPALDLIGDAPPNLDEVTPYVAARLSDVPEPARGIAASRVAARSDGNFLYAYHVVNDLLARGGDLRDADTQDLPEALEGVYRKYLVRELGANRTRWNDVYRPILGPIAVARGDGLTKEQLIGITSLAEDTATDVLGACAQFLVGGHTPSAPYRIYHQSFRDFLLGDERFNVFPAERHAAVARYLQDRYGANWGRCDDHYALRYTPAHWADAATLSAAKRDARTHALIDVAADRKYQQRFEARVADLPLLHGYLHRAVRVAALNERDDMLPAIVRAAREFVAFRRAYLRAEAVVALADAGRAQQAEGRLPLFADVDADWLAAARLILAWLSAERNPAGAAALRDTAVAALSDAPPLPLLRDRVNAALAGQPVFAAVPEPPASLEFGRHLVNRMGGQGYDPELMGSLGAPANAGYSSGFDAPILVGLASAFGDAGTALVDEYIDAHAGYNYIEYRNRSLWNVLHAVLRNHSDQRWVRDRLRRLLVTALSGGGVDFEEMLPLAASILAARAEGRDAPAALGAFRASAAQAAGLLRRQRGANDSWGSHRRRLTALMELYALALGDRSAAQEAVAGLAALPDGFAGFQAPARLRQADAMVACRMDPALTGRTLQEALMSAHHIQDYHFCARVTARCNALMRWHRTALDAAALEETIGRLALEPAGAEFAADLAIGEPYAMRPNGPGVLPIDNARNAQSLEDLVEVFQRSTVEFRALNPKYGLTDTLPHGTSIRIPDPGLAPLLAIHFAARAFADDGVADRRPALIRSLVPVAAASATALDTVLSYLAIAADLQDPDLAAEIAAAAGPVAMADVPAPAAPIGPDAVIPA